MDTEKEHYFRQVRRFFRRLSACRCPSIELTKARSSAKSLSPSTRQKRPSAESSISPQKKRPLGEADEEVKGEVRQKVSFAVKSVGRPSRRERLVVPIEDISNRLSEDSDDCQSPAKEKPAVNYKELQAEGELIFQANFELICAMRDTFHESGFSYEWSAAVEATYSYAHVCAVRDFYLSTGLQLQYKLGEKAPTWKALAATSVGRLIAKFRECTRVVKAIVIDNIREFAKSSMYNNESQMKLYTLLKSCNSIDTLCPSDNLQDVLRKLMRNDTIIEAFRETFEDIKMVKTRSFHQRYERAVDEQLEKLQLLDLHHLLHLHGQTLTCKSIVLNTPYNSDETIRMAMVIVLWLHEFGHLFLREDTKTIKEYLARATPEKGSRSRRNVTLADSEVEQVFQRDFPLEQHWEAGDYLEERLFGSHLRFITKEASQLLLNLTLSSKATPVWQFRREFIALNSLPANATGQRGDLTRGGGEAVESETCGTSLGLCGSGFLAVSPLEAASYRH